MTEGLNGQPSDGNTLMAVIRHGCCLTGSRLLFLSGLWLFGLATAYAQSPTPRDTTAVRQKTDYRPSALRIGVALNDIIRTVSNAQDTRYSGQADLAFGRFMLVGEYGIAKTSQANNPEISDIPAFTYESQGSFFRAGVDVNLLKDRQLGTYDAKDDIFLFGLRFGRAQTDDRLQFDTNDPVWGLTTATQENNGLVTTWVEMTAGVKVEVLKNVFLGYNLRFKFARNFSGEPTLLPYFIPGFGRSDKEERFGFDYSIFYRIPLRRQSKKILLYQ